MSLLGGYRLKSRRRARAGIDAVRKENLFHLEHISSAIHPVASSLHQQTFLTKSIADIAIPCASIAMLLFFYVVTSGLGHTT
jgi:hypothetical protein